MSGQGGATASTKARSGPADSDVMVGGRRDTADAISASGLSITLDDKPNDGRISIGEKDNVRSDVETVLGGNGKDEIRGSAATNQLTGNGEDDYIRTGWTDRGGPASSTGGDDTVDGGGQDFVDAYRIDGKQALRGNDGNDTVRGGNGNDVFLGGPGSRLI